MLRISILNTGLIFNNEEISYDSFIYFGEINRFEILNFVKIIDSKEIKQINQLFSKIKTNDDKLWRFIIPMNYLYKVKLSNNFIDDIEIKEEYKEAIKKVLP